jgi:FMN phosphatase YigB (HAD superfamily)
MPFLDQFDAILLDMGDTFMFGLDRFGPEEDFFGTYRGLGGNRLKEVEVDEMIHGAVERLWRDYDDPEKEGDFPSSLKALREALDGKELPEAEWALLDRVFFLHEHGHIPLDHAEAVRSLAQTHTLGLLSNIWADSARYRELLSEAGLEGLFESIIYSSDHGMIKPCAQLFEMALESIDAPRERVVMVGDNLKRDVGAAKRAEIAAVWISSGVREGALEEFEPDLTIADLRELPLS